MITILNRFPRGMYGIGAKFNGVILGLLTYFVFHNPYISIAVAIGYVLGECFGWGLWVGTLTEKRELGFLLVDEGEGRNNGIEWIASHIIKPTQENWLEYCRLALTIRGFYWWLPTLLPLYFVGISLDTLFIAISLLAIGFPIACEIGYYTSKLWNFKFMDGGSEHSEIWYGLMQDIVFIGGIVWHLLTLV